MGPRVAARSPRCRFPGEWRLGLVCGVRRWLAGRLLGDTHVHDGSPGSAAGPGARPSPRRAPPRAAPPGAAVTREPAPVVRRAGPRRTPSAARSSPGAARRAPPAAPVPPTRGRSPDRDPLRAERVGIGRPGQCERQSQRRQEPGHSAARAPRAGGRSGGHSSFRDRGGCEPYTCQVPPACVRAVTAKPLCKAVIPAMVRLISALGRP